MDRQYYSIIIIHIFLRICYSQYARFPHQPYPLTHVVPGIQRFSPFSGFLSEGGNAFLGGPNSGSTNLTPSRALHSSPGAVIMPGNLRRGVGGEIPNLPSVNGDYNPKNFDAIRFPSSKPPVPQTVSPPPVLTIPKVNSQKNTSCVTENAFVDFNGKCYMILTQGPCSVGQWLLINERDESPYCAKRPCTDKKLFYNGRCVSISDSSVCGVSEILYIDFTGNVYCDCLPHFVYDMRAQKCFAENDQGSCPFGQILDLDQNDKLKCIENTCKRDNLVYNPKDKVCYKKLYKGPCKEDKGYHLTFYEKDRTVQCGSVINRNIFEVPALTACPPGSKKDYLGNCQKILRLDNPLAWRVPSQQVSRYSQCPPGLNKYPDGSCRKLNSLLGR